MCKSYMDNMHLRVKRDLLDVIKKLTKEERAELLVHVYEKYGNSKGGGLPTVKKGLMAPPPV